ncbi:MAG: hypothetical protein CM15mV105_080 [uncultured marine virus]|nr:MAG: hypothetical protein CM15mV105_080 [uncultured marine virus]
MKPPGKNPGFSQKTKGEIEKPQDMINLMTDMPKELINQLTLEDVTKVLRVIAKLQTSKNSKFKQVIKVGNDQYGFIPDLERITLGEYADIEHYIKVVLKRICLI